MASTLKVTLQEDLTIEGINYSSSRTKTFSTITSVYKHIIAVSTTTGTILNFADAAAGIGTLDRDSVEYLRITNLDTTNFVVISLKDGSAAVAAVRLDAGRSLILPTPNTTTEHPQLAAHDSAHAVPSFVNTEAITADADTAACNIELMVAMNATT